VPGRHDTISFLSDFGHADEFVGVVHSVIRSIAPDVAVIDITHGIARHDVRAGGLALARAANYLNPGVVLAVVDPGVGGDRRPVALEVGDGVSVLVGPDNGLLAAAVGLVGGATRAVELRAEEYRLPSLGSTFDGRDVFAPAAAHLCNGVPLTALGPEIDPATLMPGMIPLSYEEQGALVAEVLWVDTYGNCQLNVDPDELPAGEDLLEVAFGDDLRIGVRCDSYDAIDMGRVGMLVDSSGLISLAVAKGSAAAELGISEGTEVRLSALDDETPQGVVTNVDLTPKGERNGPQ